MGDYLKDNYLKKNNKPVITEYDDQGGFYAVFTILVIIVLGALILWK